MVPITIIPQTTSSNSINPDSHFGMPKEVSEVMPDNEMIGLLLFVMPLATRVFTGYSNIITYSETALYNPHIDTVFLKIQDVSKSALQL
jgi:hypothetical protein